MTMLADTAATSLPDGTWSADPAHTTIEFLVKHMGLVTVRGRALGVEATIVGGTDPSIEGVVDATSLTTFDAQRDDHLHSPDFFDVERYPTLSFASSSVAREGDRLVVEGLLTIKGVTRPVTLEGTYLGSGVDPWGEERVAFDLAGSVDRREFGLTWNAPLPGGGFLLPDRVGLSASFSAIRQD